MSSAASHGTWQAPAAVPSALLAALPSALLAALLVAGCAPDAAPVHRHPLDVRFVDLDGRPVAGARVALDGHPLAASRGAGRVEGVLVGPLDAAVELSFEAPASHRVDGATRRTHRLRIGELPAQPGRRLPLPVADVVVLEPLARGVLLDVRLECPPERLEDCRRTAITLDGAEAVDGPPRPGADLRYRGRLRVEVGRAVTVSLAAPEGLDIPQSRTTFVPRGAGHVLVVHRSVGAVESTRAVESPPVVAIAPPPTAVEAPPAANRRKTTPPLEAAPRPAPAAQRANKATPERSAGRAVRAGADAVQRLGTRAAGAATGGAAPVRAATGGTPAHEAPAHVATGGAAPATAVEMPAAPHPAIGLERCTADLDARGRLDADCRRWLEARPRAERSTFGESRRLLARDAAGRRAWREVEAWMSALIEPPFRDPHPEWRFTRGQARLQIGRIEEAIEDLQAAWLRRDDWNDDDQAQRSLLVLERLAFAEERRGRERGDPLAIEQAIEHLGDLLVEAKRRRVPAMESLARERLSRLEAAR